MWYRNLFMGSAILRLTKRALFLDRDGVINVDYGYVYQKKNFHLIEGIFDLVKLGNQLGLLVVVVTNQSGIARGYYTENEFWDFSEWMLGIFQKNNAKIDSIYYSPYHPTKGIGKYKIDEETRKPKPGMILKAAKELQINLKRSILIGDKITDLHAANSAGIGTKILYKPRKEAFLDDNLGFKFTTISSLDSAQDILRRNKLG